MGIPPRGDPDRALYVAVRLLVVLAVMLFTFCAAAISLVVVGDTPANGEQSFNVLLVKIVAVIYGAGPAMALLICAGFVSEKRWAAVTAALVVTSLHLLVTGWALLGRVIDVIHRPWIEEYIAMGILGLFAAVEVATVWFLGKSFRAVERQSAHNRRGFEPVIGAQASKDSHGDTTAG